MIRQQGTDEPKGGREVVANLVTPVGLWMRRFIFTRVGWGNVEAGCKRAQSGGLLALTVENGSGLGWDFYRQAVACICIAPVPGPSYRTDTERM